jgi:hypothetical protein
MCYVVNAYFILISKETIFLSPCIFAFVLSNNSNFKTTLSVLNCRSIGKSKNINFTMYRHNIYSKIYD